MTDYLSHHARAAAADALDGAEGAAELQAAVQSYMDDFIYPNEEEYYAEYAALDNGDWGGGHIRDIVELAAAARTLDFIDEDHLFIAGMSFGGFSVMSLLTQYPGTFRAAVDFFGFTELASFVDSWPRYLQRHLAIELGFDPRIDRARNRALSPLYHVERISIPLQIHQGANDSRVPRSQSDWLVQRLRSLGVHVVGVVVAGMRQGGVAVGSRGLG